MAVHEGYECELPAVAVRWYDDEPQPGLVEVHVTDRHGAVHVLVEKTAYFPEYDDFDPDATYPRPAHVTCTVIAVDGEDVRVRSWWCTDVHGEPLEFDVRVADLRPLIKP